MRKFHNVLQKCKSYLGLKGLRHRIHEKAKKCNICPHCGEVNGTVKKCGALKISYEKYRNKKSDTEVELKLSMLRKLFGTLTYMF